MNDTTREAVERLARDCESANPPDASEAASTLRAQAARIEALEADVARLRKALKEIASGKFVGVMLTSMPPKDAAQEYARAAIRAAAEGGE